MDRSPCFRIAHAVGCWPAAAKSCAAQLGSTSGANLGFLYVTDALSGDLSSILTFLREVTRIEDWVGSVGIGICAGDTEYFDQPAIAVMTASLAPGSFRVFPPVCTDLSGFRRNHRDWVAQAKPALGLVHGDPRNPRIPALVAGLADATSAFLVGGLTSSRRGFEQIAGEVGEGGLSGVLFAGEVPVATGLAQGCSPVGPAHTVTAGAGNVLSELDNRNALEVLAEDAGEELSEAFLRDIAAIEVAIPIAGSDTGDYLVRNLIGVDAERGLLVIGERIAMGDKLMFVRRGERAAAADMRRMVGQLRRRVGGAPKAGVYVACVGRGPSMFGEPNREITLIREGLGEFPLIGFFASGEICHNRLYGYTGVLTLFLQA